jgi:hypothetical protein
MGSVRTGMGMVLAAGLLFLVGCGGNPLDGSWSTTNSNAGTTTKETVDLQSDLTATVSFKVTQSPAPVTCKGSIEFTGYDWSSTDTNITLSGSASCKSSLVCMAAGQSVAVGCSPMQNIAGTCHYKLSSDENTLVVSECSNKGMSGTVTFTRDQM